MYSGVDFPSSHSASPTSSAPLPYWLGSGPNSHAIPSSLPCSSTLQSFPAIQSSTPMNHHHSYSTPAAAAPIPLQEPAELLPIINPLLIDNLAKDFNLTSNQKSYLHAFMKFGSVDGGLSKADLSARLFSMAIDFDLYNKPKTIDDENNTDTMWRMLRDIQIRLEQNFSLTPMQQKTIQAIVQDMLYDPLRTCYHDISADVFVSAIFHPYPQSYIKLQDELKKNAKQYHFDNIFNVPAYENVLQKAII
ncbi:hypothetical protein EV359DRAFT_86812 [Lentinula novae-zelandiae]|nr:hypothetical protein EV359DRAFT_86812 [Lentinula novae-zelandiae]